MTTLNELKQQVERFNRLPTKNFLEREEIRIKLLKEVGAYFQGRFAETSGLLTAELMQEVDAVYDVRGIPSVIAKALGVHVNYFHGALARERSVPCAGGCGKMLAKVVRRRVGGYTSVHDELCSQCRRQRHEAEDQQEQQWYQREKEVYDRWLEMDHWLSESDQPLSSTPYVRHLYWYYTSWLKGRWTYFINWGYYSPPYKLSDPTGCMLCGSDEVSLYLINTNLIPHRSDFYKVVGSFYHAVSKRENALEAESYIPPLVTYHQALWNLTPSVYFSKGPRYPFLKQPLLILCPACGALAASSHHRVEFEATSLRSFSYEQAALNPRELIPSASACLHLHSSGLPQLTRRFIQSLRGVYEEPFLHLGCPDEFGSISIELEREYFQNAIEAGLLIIGGLDEYHSGWEHGRRWRDLTFVLDERMRQGRPVIFVTPCDLAQLKRILGEAESEYGQMILGWIKVYIERQIILQEWGVVVEAI